MTFDGLGRIGRWCRIAVRGAGAAAASGAGRDERPVGAGVPGEVVREAVPVDPAGARASPAPPVASRARAVWIVSPAQPAQLGPTASIEGCRWIATTSRAFSRDSVPQPGYAAGAIQGRVLEIGGREYVDRFGLRADAPTAGRVHRVDVLHASLANPRRRWSETSRTRTASRADTFDCIICTQTLHVIFDTRAALRTLHGALKPGGTLLLTVPGITRSSVPDRDVWGDWWRFTASSVRRLLEAEFDCGSGHVEAYGNVLTAAGFLYGLAAEDLRAAELDGRDRDFEVVVTARAIKS